MKVAALDPAKKKELLDKYKDWNQIPFIMSPAATEGFFEKNPNPADGFTTLIIKH